MLSGETHKGNRIACDISLACGDSERCGDSADRERDERPTSASPVEGLSKLYMVKRAILMAAGSGTRMRPLTLSTPKPLIRVCGVRMIDSVISALHRNGIFEIYVVVGYLKEKFSDLEAEYPGLRLIENPDWARCNNISSLYAAREHLSDCLILDADQLIRDPSVLAPEFVRSGYNAIWTEEETSEWLLTLRDCRTGALLDGSTPKDALRIDGRITRCSRTGGKGGWQLFSISRWSAEDGARLCRHLELEFKERRNTSVYWDDVPLFCHSEDYELGVFPMQPGDVTEIDTLLELAAEDPSYLNLSL